MIDFNTWASENLILCVCGHDKQDHVHKTNSRGQKILTLGACLRRPSGMPCACKEFVAKAKEKEE